jgi:hypothetical protein
VLARLAVGQIAPHLIESGTQFLIPRRLDPSRLPPPLPVRTDLTFTEPADAAYWLSRASARRARGELRRIAAESSDALGLSRSQKVAFKTLHETPWPHALDGEDAADERRAAIERWFVELQTLLGKAAYDRYRGLLDARLERLILYPQRAA